MTDAVNRAKHLISTLDRENAVAFSSVRGVLTDCILEIEQNMRYRAALQVVADQRTLMECSDEEIDDGDYEQAFDIVILDARAALSGLRDT